VSAAETLDCDLVVIGAGMAGLTAAALAAEQNARVTVVEKAPDIGGSASLSGGYLWTATSLEQARRHDDGDPALKQVVIEEYPRVLAWLGSSGIEMGKPQAVLYGRGRQIDMAAHLQRAVRLVESVGGHVVRSTNTLRLVVEDGTVRGAVTSHPDGEVAVRAPAVLLATGGFQANAELRGRHIHPAARDMQLRSNPASTGDGLSLGVAAGGAWAGPNSGFYGHLIAYPVTMTTDSDFVRFTQYHSIHGVLLNRKGQRFVDESDDDHASSQLVIRQPGATALLVWDDHVQRNFALAAPVAGAEPLDRFRIAIEAGARGAKLASLEKLAAFADGLGFDGSACLATLRAYNDAMHSAPERAVPPREKHDRPLAQPPFYALEVASAITFTYGGLLADDKARALDCFGAPIPGLLVAGADVGNIYRRGYCGGLALAATFAMRAMRTAGFLDGRF
jgi:predicted oxidoreductase